MGVEELDVMLCGGFTKAIGDGEVDAWASSEVEDHETFFLQLFAERADFVQTEKDEVVLVLQLASQCGGQHFGTGQIKTVQQMPDGGAMSMGRGVGHFVNISVNRLFCPA